MPAFFRTAATVAFGAMLVAAGAGLVLVFAKGATWVATNMLSPLVRTGWIVLIVDVAVLLPLSAIRGLRSITGIGLMMSSYLFGLILWMTALLETYLIWGMAAVVVGLLLLGGGIVPIALAATIWNGLWDEFLPLLALIALTFGFRGAGYAIASSAASIDRSM